MICSGFHMMPTFVFNELTITSSGNFYWRTSVEDLHGAPLFSVENDMLTEILFSLEENKINLFQYVYFLRFSFSVFPFGYLYYNTSTNMFKWQQHDSTRNYLVSKRALNYLAKLTRLAKWLSDSLITKRLRVRIGLLLLKLSCLFQARNSLTISQL